jgi:hypothetical protein
MPGSVFHSLRRLWLKEERRDEYVGTLVNAYLEAGGKACGLKAGTAYADVGTLEGYSMALDLLAEVEGEARGQPPPVGKRQGHARENAEMVR